MKQLDLPFKIDKQYENWQFELDALDDRLRDYHSYKYVGKQLNSFLNFTTQKTELIFNGDILTSVIITIKQSDIYQLNSIIQILVLDASKEIIIDENSRKFKIWRVNITTTFKANRKEIIVIYESQDLFKNIYPYYYNLWKRHTIRHTYQFKKTAL